MEIFKITMIYNTLQFLYSYQFYTGKGIIAYIKCCFGYLFKLFVLKVALVEDIRFAEDVGSQLNQSVIHGTKIKAMDLAPRH